MKGSVGRAFRIVHDAFRAQLWPIPVAGVVIAVLVGLSLPRVDAAVDESLPTWLTAILFSGDPGAARTMLDAVASSLITVTSLTFSLTVVTLQLASSQYSPRLLRTFTQDVFVQFTLALFLATFTYSLTVLRSVRSGAEDGTGSFVPRIAVTSSLLLALASVIVLVLFLAHLTRQIRVETMLNLVHQIASQTSSANLKRRSEKSPPIPERPAQPARIFADTSGFLVSVDQSRLVALAHSFDVVVALDREAGDFLVPGTPLASFWTPGGGRISDHNVAEKLRAGVCDAVYTGSERTAAQDVGYGIRQLTDIVCKALSPGINDPTTAVHALGHISSLLVELMEYQLGPMPLAASGGDTRVVIHRPSFEDYLELAIAQPRTYGISDPIVVQCLYRLLEDVAWNAHGEQRGAIAEQLQRLQLSVDMQPYDAVEKSRFAACHRNVSAALERQSV